MYDDLCRSGRIRGKFPYLSYVGIDDKPELVYEICRESMGPLLSIEHEIKKIGRKLRRKQFQREVIEKGGTTGPWLPNNETKMLYGKLVKKITGEAADMFEETIRFAERDMLGTPLTSIKKFKKDMAEATQAAYAGWVNTLGFFEHFCLEEQGKEERHYDGDYRGQSYRHLRVDPGASD